MVFPIRISIPPIRYIKQHGTIMSSPEDKAKHSRRIRNKRKEKVRSNIAKDLLTSGKYKQRVIKDKRGKEHDLSKMTHRDLIEAIQDNDND